MSVFETVKAGVSCREAVERWGIAVNRHNMALCPFHEDHHPSLYVDDDHYHCFGCGAHGDVIDFAARFFSLSGKEAAQKLAAEFLRGKPSATPIKTKTPTRPLRQQEQLCFLLLSDYRKLLDRWQRELSPVNPGDVCDPRFAEACRNRSTVDELLDTLTVGCSEEQASVVELLTADGKLDRLREHLKGGQLWQNE